MRHVGSPKLLKSQPSRLHNACFLSDVIPHLRGRGLKWIEDGLGPIHSLESMVREGGSAHRLASCADVHFGDHPILNEAAGLT